MPAAWTHDLLHAFRALKAVPFFTALIILTLGLGIGANTALYTIVDGVLLEPLPFSEPERLVMIWQQGERGLRNSVSRETFDAWREEISDFEDMAATRGAIQTFLGSAGAERLTGIYSTKNLFSLLGVGVRHGRTFREDDEPLVIILRPDIARRFFGSPQAAIGQTLKNKERIYTVIGIADEDFRFPDDDTQFWVPFPSDELMRNITVTARLKNDAETTGLPDRLSIISARFATEEARNMSTQALMEPLGAAQVEDVERQLYLMQGAIGFLLLIACANVSNLLLVRAGKREQEIAVRRALGADDRRIFRLLFAESLILSFCGGLVGLALTAGFLRVLPALVHFDLPRSHNIELDASAFALAAAATFACAFLCGILPALNLSRSAISGRLSGHRAATSVNLQNGFAVAQIALATILLAGGGLLLRSFHELRSVDPGFQKADRVSFRMSLSASESYAEDTARLAFYERFKERLLQIPGVEAVGRTSYLPVHQGRGFGSTFQVAGHDNSSAPVYMYRVVCPDYLPTLGATLLRGRLLTADDGRVDGAPGVLINEAIADVYWPGWREENGPEPLGAEITLGPADDPLATGTIVGVVANMKDIQLDFDSMELLYVPHGLIPFWPVFTQVIETKVEASFMYPQIRAALAELDPTLPLYELSTLEERVARTIAKEQASAVVVAVFALLALALAASGVFSVLAYQVSRRQREIAVRRALGASDGILRSLVMRRALGQTALGLLFGIAGALALGRWMESLLFGVPGLDPPTLFAVILLLGATALTAGYLPAQRATRGETWTILRSE